MALKSCPRCFREIPEEAKVCPHCNTEVRTCPKCGTLALKDADTCSRCGIKLPKFNPLIESPDTSIDDVVNHVQGFKRKNAFLSVITNQVLWSAFSAVMMVVGAIMFLLSLNGTNISLWSNNSSTLMWALVIEFLGYSVKAAPSVISELVLPTKLYKYTEASGYKILPKLANGGVVVMKNSKSIFSTRKINFDLAKTSEYAKANPQEYTRYAIFNIVRLAAIVISTAGMIGGMTWLNFSAPALVASGTNVLKSAPMILVYVSVGIDLLTSMALSFYMTGFNKSRDEWVKTAE